MHEMRAFVKKQREDGKWEIISQTGQTPFAVGASSWVAENDADFWEGHLNQAYLEGVKAGAYASKMLGGGDELEAIRGVTIRYASRNYDAAKHDPEVVVRAANLFANFIAKGIEQPND